MSAMTTSRSFVLVAAALSLGACQNGRSPAPTQHQGQASPTEITLRTGDSTEVDHIPIRFSGVLEDSRCPTDVTCVWAGNAQAALGVGPRRGTQGPTERVVLNTNTSVGTDSAESSGLRLTLLDIFPAPKSTQPIPPGNYFAKLKVEVVAAP